LTTLKGALDQIVPTFHQSTEQQVQVAGQPVMRRGVIQSFRRSPVYAEINLKKKTDAHGRAARSARVSHNRQIIATFNQTKLPFTHKMN
jgi:hypothetical protein